MLLQLQLVDEPGIDFVLRSYRVRLRVYLIFGKIAGLYPYLAFAALAFAAADAFHSGAQLAGGVQHGSAVSHLSAHPGWLENYTMFLVFHGHNLNIQRNRITKLIGDGNIREEWNVNYGF